MTQTQRDQLIANLNQIKKDLKHPNRIAFVFESKTTSLNVDENDDCSLIINEIKKLIDIQILNVPEVDEYDVPENEIK